MQNRLPQSTKKNSCREEGRDSGVFLKACDESATSQLNPDRDNFSYHPAPILNFSPFKLGEQFRFGAQGNLIPNLNNLENCVGEIPKISCLPTTTSSGLQVGKTTPAVDLDLFFRFGEIQTKQEPQAGNFFSANQGENHLFPFRGRGSRKHR